MTLPRPAGPERRFYAFVLDRALAGVLVLPAALLAWWLWWSSGAVAEGVLLVVGVGLVVWLAHAALQGGWGTSPGRLVLGLRLLDAGTGEPIGVGRAMLRGLVLAAATVPTVGLGTASLAWTALSDPEGRRRGWHDHLVGSVVLDVRPVPARPDETVEEEVRGVVNLTAMRLAPTGAPAPGGAAPTPVGPDHAPGAGAGRTATRRPVALARRWRLAVDTGQSVVVEGLLLVGRDPEPRPGEQVRQVMALPSTDMSLSKTHAQLHVVEGTLVVMDRGSTNGSVLNRRGVARELRAGRPATLLEGDVVRLGDRELRVERQE